MQVHLPSDLERRLVCALSALPPKEANAFDLDGLLLGLAAQQAINTMMQGDAAPLLVNVRFDVFATRAATERYIALCLKIDQRVCGRIVMLLSALPQGLPRTRLLECVIRLRPFCRSVGYQAEDLASVALFDLSQNANTVVALPMTAFSSQPPEKLRGLIGSLHSRRAKLMVYGVPSEEDAAALRTAGAEMIAMRRPA